MISFCLAVGLLLTAAVCAVFRDREPSYQGRTLSEWADLWPERQDEASEAIHHIGTNSFPIVLKWLRSGPSPWREKMLGRAYSSPDWMRPDFLVNWLSDDQAKKRVGRAYQVIRILGEEAGPMVAELEQLSYEKSPFVAFAAFDGLAYIGRAGFLHLLRVSEDAKNPHHGKAVERLGWLLQNHPSSTNIIQALFQCAGDKDVMVQKEASLALAKWAIKQPAGVAIDKFKRSVGSTNEVFLRWLRQFEMSANNGTTNNSPTP